MPLKTIRSFFACEISPEILQKIGNLQTELKTALPRSVIWVNPKNIHLTIKFIGEFNTVHLDPLEQSLAKALEPVQPFEMEIKGMGVFPSFSKPRVIWLGIKTDNTLERLVEIVNRECTQFKYPCEQKPFSAHITLGRVKSYATSEDHRLIADQIRLRETMIIGNQTINSLYFFKSILMPDGPVYSKLTTFSFLPTVSD